MNICAYICISDNESSYVLGRPQKQHCHHLYKLINQVHDNMSTKLVEGTTIKILVAAN